MMVSHEGAFKPVGLQGYRQGWSKAEPLCMGMERITPLGVTEGPGITAAPMGLEWVYSIAGVTLGFASLHPCL